MSIQSHRRSIEPFKLAYTSLHEISPVILPLYIFCALFAVLNVASRIILLDPIINLDRLQIIQLTLSHQLIDKILPILLWIFITSAAIYSIVTGTTIAFLYRYLQERSVDLKGAFNHNLGRIFKLMIAWILYQIAIWLGCLFFIIPGIYLSIAYYFFVFSLVLEKCSLRESFIRSFRLIRWHWWGVFGSLSIGIIFFIFPIYIFIGVFNMVLNILAIGTTSKSIILIVMESIFTALAFIIFHLYSLKIWLKLNDIKHPKLIHAAH
jgi:hypothetical protein